MKTQHGPGRWRTGLGLLQVFVGIGAVGGGGLMLMDPSGAGLGAEVGWLAGSPFRTYLIPGIVLFAVNGLGSFWGAWLLFSGDQRAPWASIGLGSFLMAWILCQVIWLEPVSFLQPFFFLVGAMELVGGVRGLGEAGG